MMQSILNILMLTFTIMFSLLKHPLTMGFLLLIQTTLICFITGNLHESFWFSYILFLVFLGGMLVLFIYVTSLASNEMFTFSFKILIILMSFIFILSFINFLTDFMSIVFMNNNEMINFSTKTLLHCPENLKSIYKLYNFPTNWITLLLINYLFFTLIIAVKITNFFYGPIRNLN